MLTKDKDQPPFLSDHPARQRRRGPRPRRGCRGGLRLASRQSAMGYRPRQVNDTTEDDDDCSWNSSESDEGEPAAGTAEDGRNDAMLDEVSVASAALIAAVFSLTLSTLAISLNTTDRFSNYFRYLRHSPPSCNDP